MTPATNSRRKPPAQAPPYAERLGRTTEAAARPASVRRRDRFDATRRISFPPAAAGALPIEQPRSETAILAGIARQIFGALADQRTHQFEFTAPRLFSDSLLRLEQTRHAGQIRRLLHL